MFMHTHYYTDDRNRQRASEKCRKLPDNTAATVTVTSSVLTLLLLLVLVAVTVVVVMVKKPKILFQKPDPPFKGENFYKYI